MSPPWRIAVRSRSVPPLLAILGGLAVFCLQLAPAEGPAPRDGGLRAGFAEGNLAVTNSENGSAILTAGNMRPGDTATGAVTIRNAGSIPAYLTLSDSDLVEAPSPNGGRLSERLNLRVQDATAGRVPATVFEGKMFSLGHKKLGTLSVADSRTYRFAVTLPDGGAPRSDAAGDNQYAGSSLSVTYRFQTGGSGLWPGPCANRRLGTHHSDALRGTDFGDRIYGRRGNDRIEGLPGRNCLFGHGGADRLLGGPDSDRLSGGSGNDLLSGRSGNDRLFGGLGQDVLSGGSSMDRLSGNSGHDSLAGGPGDDWQSGGSGGDSLLGGAGDDRLNGGSGHDQFAGGPGRDRITSADGVPETVSCGEGSDAVLADRRDRLTGCEHVSNRSRATDR
jgi:Ca2+-binding RTX toxin-like protein